MPAEKRPPESPNDDTSSPFHSKQPRHEGRASGEEGQSQRPPHQSPPPELPLKQEDDAPVASASDDDSDASDTGDPQDQEFVYVDLQSIRKEVQCPICLGIIKKTRTVMECLHRFCRECIDKSMRMGNNECPACRTHCASRRSLRDDPIYDSIIAALYPDIKKFEEEELAFCEEDENRNKQIQDSIAQVYRKQSEALGKKRPTGKDATSTSVTRPQRSCRNVQPRRRRRRRNASPEYQDSDDNNDANDIDKHSDPDEHHTETKQRKGRSRASIGSSHSLSSTNLSGGSFENILDQRIEGRGLSPGLTCSTEMLAWGRGGVRSSTRTNSINGGMSRSAQRIRLAKLVDFLRNLEENDDEYVALQNSLKAENVQMLGMRDPNSSSDHQSTLHPSSRNDKISEVDPLQNRLHILEREALSGAVANCISNGEPMILAYQQKEAT